MSDEAGGNAHLGQRLERYGPPVEDAAHVALVIHGRAQSPDWMREFLLDRLDMPDVAFVAPEAADNTWYAGGFMEAFDTNEPHLSWALERIDQLLIELENAGRPRSEVFLLGFSQGACLVAEYVSRHPGRYGGVAVLTGGLIGPPGTAWDGASLDGTPVLMATSDIDEWVPLARVEESRDALESRGAVVTWRVYQGMDHIINDDEVRLVREMFDAASA